jgi:ketosteroid isomerase-like protein
MVVDMTSAPVTAQEEERNLAIVAAYLQAVADPGETFATLGRFLHPDIIQEEFPNAVVPQGARRDLVALAAAHARGAQVVTRQRYDVLRTVAQGDRVAVELEWSGTLLVAYGSLVPGSVMRAHLGIFFDLLHGRIIGQRNYDCYRPWSV